MKTEKEKMLAGGPYDGNEPELFQRWHLAQKLIKAYNATETTDHAGRMELLDRLLGSHGENLMIASPFAVDYGENIHLGENCEINFNCVFLDCNKITIGKNALIAPGVHLYTAYHPVRVADRLPEKRDDENFAFCKTLTAPVTIGDNVWIGGGAIVLPGVTIGNNVTIGAGSVVTHDIPDNVLAFGNPCRVIKAIH